MVLRFYCDQGMKIRLSFNDVDLQGMNVGGGCKSQFVEVIEMYYSASQGKYCGERIPGDYVSKGSFICYCFSCFEIL